MLRLLVAAAVCVLLLGAAAAVAARRGAGPFAARLTVDAQALVSVRSPFAAHVADLRVSTRDGAVPVRVTDAHVWPRVRLPVGERVTVEVVFRRPAWLGWLLGGERRVRLTLTTPSARLSGRWLQFPRGQAVSVGFDRPVRLVAFGPQGRQRRRVLPAPRRTVDTGLTVDPPHAAGSLLVSAAPRTWEQLPAPQRVTWFPAGPRVRALVRPAPGGSLKPLQDLRLTFSEPVARVLGGTHPALEPRTPGRWTEVDNHTLVFHPTGAGFGLGTRVHVALPVAVDLGGGKSGSGERGFAWTVPDGSTLRLQQLLAGLGYLPLAWTPSGAAAPHTPRAELAAAVDPPAGRFRWRYAHVPRPLKALWRPGQPNAITRGAVIAFEHEHDLIRDGVAGPRVWRALIGEAASTSRTAASASTRGYSYVLVHRKVPQRLVLWHDGRTILRTLVNTGVPSAPTELGTYTVWLRFRTQTMAGVNPDGSHYSDPGIRWISYFHDGEAIHGFQRSSYGFPQSVGCVELPVAAAARVWPYTPIGTLVTIAN